MQVRWTREQPKVEFEMFIGDRWVRTTREVIEQALRDGEMVTWNPTGGKS